MSLHYLVKKKEVAAERLLLTRTTFSQSVMVSVGVSKLGVTDLIFVDPKVNGECPDFLLQMPFPDVPGSPSFFAAL